MKILHTADWHLGHRLFEYSQYEEQSLFLGWLKELIVKDNIDVLLISGDVFDTNTPSTQSLKMYYDFLVQLLQTSCKHIVITGGNHDSPSMLDAPKDVLRALDIKVVGKSTGNIEDEVFLLQTENEAVIVGATAYLRDQDIRRAVDGEKFEEITDRYKTALINHYQQVADYAVELQKENKNAPIIGMGHLFAVGGSVSDSEQSIYVGTLGHIGAEDFPKAFDYIALGHLHRPQIVGGNENIRYSGSPNVLSFSEIGYDKKVIILETKDNNILNIEDEVVPTYRNVVRLKGNKEACLKAIENVSISNYGLDAWVEVALEDEKNDVKGFSEIYEAVKDKPVEILKVTRDFQRTTEGLEQLAQNAESIKDLSPEEVFEKKYEESGYTKEELSEVIDAYNEILTIVREEN